MAEKPTTSPQMGIPRDRVFLTPRDLVERWKRVVSEKTLANWRWAGRGPAFVKVDESRAAVAGRRVGGVLYELRDVRDWETSNRMASTQQGKTTAATPQGTSHTNGVSQLWSCLAA